MTKFKYILLGIVVGLLCTACGKETEEMTTISIDKKGTVEHTILEEFGAEYNVDDLQQMVLGEVASYQKNRITDTAEDVKVSKVEMTDEDKVLIQMSFPTVEDFKKFQNIHSVEENEFFFGTVKEAYDAGYSLNVTLHERENDSVLLDHTAILENGDKKMIIYDPDMNYDSQQGIGAPVIIRTYDSIYALSDNVVIQDKKDAWIGNTSDLAYIILDN